jgi:cell division protein FtsA
MSKHLKAQLEIPGAEVSEAQRDRVMDTLHARAQAREGELLHEELTAFIVDDADEVIEPAGLFADRLAAGLLAIWAERASLSNLINAVERAHLDVEACVPGAYAAGLAVLHVEEADVGGVVVDMGAAHTSFAYFAGNRLRAADVTPVGGDHITHDLAHAFSYSREGAETLKVKQGVANMASSLALDPVELEEGLDLNGRPPDSGIIAGVIGPRVEETFELLRDRLRDAGVPGNVKILLTGGASQLNGVEHYARKILGRRTRLALPRALRGAPQLTRQAAFAGAVGTAIRAMMAPQPERRRLRAGGRGRSVWRWLVDNF